MNDLKIFMIFVAFKDFSSKAFAQPGIGFFEFRISNSQFRVSNLAGRHSRNDTWLPLITRFEADLRQVCSHRVTQWIRPFLLLC
jgi:hypothetical protein